MISARQKKRSTLGESNVVALDDQHYLVGGFNHFLCFIIYGIILPIDFHIFQDVKSPPTSYIQQYGQDLNLR